MQLCPKFAFARNDVDVNNLNSYVINESKLQSIYSVKGFFFSRMTTSRPADEKQQQKGIVLCV
jgi:hypothetical protein